MGPDEPSSWRSMMKSEVIDITGYITGNVTNFTEFWMHSGFSKREFCKCFSQFSQIDSLEFERKHIFYFQNAHNNGIFMA